MGKPIRYYPKGIIGKDDNVRAFKKSDLVTVDDSWVSGTGYIEVREEGAFENKGFYLNDDFNWEIVEDDCGEIVLVPTRKD